MKVGDMIKPRYCDVKLRCGTCPLPVNTNDNEYSIHNAATGEATPAAMIVDLARATSHKVIGANITAATLLVAGKKVLVSNHHPREQYQLESLFEVV